jgi:protein-S-isoprenylcysteine O-methyltransferase Ste14
MDSRGVAGQGLVMRSLDLPPVWLFLHLVLAWVLARLDPLGLHLGGGLADLLAGLLVGGGVVLILVAVAQMRQHRTAVMPRQEASQLLSTGVFRRSRNPIYLGMALVLLGWVLRLGEPVALALVPVFVWIIETRFIAGEELMLARRFGAAWERYRGATRRWL